MRKSRACFDASRRSIQNLKELKDLTPSPQTLNPDPSTLPILVPDPQGYISAAAAACHARITMAKRVAGAPTKLSDGVRALLGALRKKV